MPETLKRWLAPYASLKLTVVLLAMATFLVFAGTVAQIDQGIWTVVDEYFRCAFTRIELRIFFPRDWTVPGAFYFPGGWLIGGALFVNVLCAHLIRFKINAKGGQLVAGTAVLAAGGVLTYLIIIGVFNQDIAATEDAAFWRVLLRLGKGGGAALVMMIGCQMLFGKRAGIVLLHGGIILLLISEFITGTSAVEGRMRINAGESVNFVEHMNASELAFIDRSDPETDTVIVIPEQKLVPGTRLRHEALPVDVQVLEFQPHSQAFDAMQAGPEIPNPATAGSGLFAVTIEQPETSGTDTEQTIDIPAVYVKLLDKSTDAALGTYLATPWLTGTSIERQTVAVGDKEYDLKLRFARSYKPYHIELLEFRHDKYVGTEKPKNFSSLVRLVDGSTGIDRTVKIWMNNPLRYAGETFYQSSFEPGKNLTILQVVRNDGWMIPYLSCMFVGFGMTLHMGTKLLAFLRPEGHGMTSVTRIFPIVVALLAAGWLASSAVPPRDLDGFCKVNAFGRLPVVYQGRVKPFDTMARNTLVILSDRQHWKDEDGVRRPAIEWLLDVMSNSHRATHHKVFRIHSLDLQTQLGLERRKGYRYALDEFEDKLPEVEMQAARASRLEPAERDVYDMRVLEFFQKINLYRLLGETHAIPDVEQGGLNVAMQRLKMIERFSVPHAIPPRGEEEEWTPMLRAILDGAMSGDPNPAVRPLAGMLLAWGRGDCAQFNEHLAGYQAYLDANPVPGAPKLSLEAGFNNLAPFYRCSVLYVIAFLVACFAWLGWTENFRRIAFWMLMTTFVAHTAAIVARVYISGYPPITNLYGTAVFIGWGCVLLGLSLESIYKLGVGNLLSALVGFLTLLIAHFLSGDGDTLEMMQAVLDTKFWLATHVIIINFGYSATFLAGALAIVYILRGVFTKSLDANADKALGRMMYGILCFALLLSFLGTVLGGLWADDSWGRFWGWDPKENGALMIVLWNALILHARWGGMIKTRGIAVLSVFGSVITAWSWFGVNQLGVGLHSYGFTESVAFWLIIFVISQIAIMGIGILPRRMWRSSSLSAP